VCWIAAASAFAAGRHGTAGALLAIPTAIKLYPVLMLAAPLSALKRAREVRRTVALFVAVLIVCSIAVPFVAYGSRAWELTRSFWGEVILSPAGQVAYMQRVRTGSNQSLDTVLLRYLSYDYEFHVLYPDFPHLGLAWNTVLGYANALRGIVLLVTIKSIRRWRRRSTGSGGDVLVVSALWSCALYLLLPETKPRYAVYSFLGFVPLVAAVVEETAGDSRARALRIAAILICVILIGGLVPDVAKTYGLGLFGAILLWAANVKLAWGVERQTALEASAIAPRRSSVSS
jgi:hypothetical protein